MNQTQFQEPETLEDLIKQLHEIFSGDKINVEEVQTLMESYKSNPADWSKFAKFDKYRYVFVWLLRSSIHDHANSHCFLKILQGQLKETLYNWPDGNHKNQELTKKWEKTFLENQCTYINDTIGLHRVENVSHTEGAVSLHLYSPPFNSCHCFDERTGHKNQVNMTFWSRFGERTPFEASVSKENN
ncbi:cysteine dioxygenase type 1 [Rhincodon typus]|uniref:cysteine dioxygenase type 1 n=1 Tax=Rhincodon typus TaxID=259920 RepID=UPI00202F3308|nr:cysteine dioxygenase type 1 [Rhincodon typus]